LQMKCPFSHVFPPFTSFSLPHLSQVLFDIPQTPFHFQSYLY
jgi:hypothetical protein